MELTSYNAKDKLEGRTETTVLSSDGTEVNLRSQTYDEKDKEVVAMEFTMRCEADALHVDMRRFMAPETTAAWEGMENVSFEIEGDMLEFPSRLNVGQQLPDAVMTMKMMMSGSQFMTITIMITNRVVESKEDVTTPLGTFSCYKITYDFEAKSIIGTKSKGADWISMEKGVMRTESYNNAGKLQNYSVRTK